MQTTFVDFYQKNKITPVSQDISNLQIHFNRRAALYHHLGIPPAFLEGKSIIEFGPGGGHNALFTLSCHPAKYVLVDGNKLGLYETQQRLEEFKHNARLETQLYFQHSLIEEYTSNELYDLVICEGLLPFQSNPNDLLRHVRTFQKIGGILIVTCIDSVSYLSDSLRKLMGLAISRKFNSSRGGNEDVNFLAENLIPFFEPQLKNLTGMSRPIIDWILDNVLQPFYGETFSISNAIKVMHDQANVLGSSPVFCRDWRWYKNIIELDTGFNKLMLHEYWENMHNFLDYTLVSPARNAKLNMEMASITDDIFAQVLAYQKTGENAHIYSVMEDIEKLSPFIYQLNDNKVFRSLGDAKNILQQIVNGRGEPVYDAFSDFFGRGQQYLSFIKHS